MKPAPYAFEPGKTLYNVLSKYKSPRALCDLGAMWIDMERDFLESFVAEVNRHAEQNMLKTGKLEGSHHAAIKQIMAQYK